MMITNCDCPLPICSLNVGILLRYGSILLKGSWELPTLRCGDEIWLIIADEKREKLSRFCIRYAFQSVLYAVWRERNKVLHGESVVFASNKKDGR